MKSVYIHLYILMKSLNVNYSPLLTHPSVCPRPSIYIYILKLPIIHGLQIFPNRLPTVATVLRKYDLASHFSVKDLIIWSTAFREQTETLRRWHRIQMCFSKAIMLPWIQRELIICQRLSREENSSTPAASINGLMDCVLLLPPIGLNDPFVSEHPQK